MQSYCVQHNLLFHLCVPICQIMAAGTNHVGCLEEEALKRRERLKSLKRKADIERSVSVNANNQDNITLPKYIFV